ncbi:hypothetical protein, partial [Xanthomonas axonopodis]|uniref:hypothetical protein n=1 Tax=Xanthomonas axonopodis TaxID=53413 RepID=UPI001C4DDFB6
RANQEVLSILTPGHEDRSLHVKPAPGSAWTATCPWQVVAAARENGSMVERSSISATRALRIRIAGVMHHADDVFEVAQHEFDPSRTAAPVGQE